MFKLRVRARILSIIVSVLVLSGLSLTSCAQFAGATEPKTVRVFSARTASVGLIKTFVSDSAVRIELGDEQTYLVAAAPTWKVVLFNAKTQKGLNMSYEQWLAHTTSWNYGSDDAFLDQVPLLKVGPLKVQRLDCVRYALATRLADGKIVPKRSGLPGEYVVYENGKVPVQAIRIIGRAFNLPLIDGLPVRLTLFEKPGEKAEVSALTRRIGGVTHYYEFTGYSECPFKQALFSYPGSFKSVRKEAEVFMDPGRTKQVEQLLDYMK